AELARQRAVKGGQLGSLARRLGDRVGDVVPDGSGINDGVEVLLGDETVLAGLADRVDGDAAVFEMVGIAGDGAVEAVGDRGALYERAGKFDLRLRVPGEIVALKHVERRIDPAEIGIALIARRRDRQPEAFADQRLRALVGRDAGGGERQPDGGGADAEFQGTEQRSRHAIPLLPPPPPDGCKLSGEGDKNPALLVRRRGAKAARACRLTLGPPRLASAPKRR